METLGRDKPGGNRKLCAGTCLRSCDTCHEFRNGAAVSQNSKIKENYHNVEELEDFVQEIAEVVPENTHGFGLNVAEVYSLLHWNTQCFTMDFSDMAVLPESLQELQEQLIEADAPYVFTSRSSLPIWERNDPETYQWFGETYELDQTFPYYEEEFQFYRKK